MTLHPAVHGQVGKFLRAAVEVHVQDAFRVRAEAAFKFLAGDAERVALDGLVFMRVTPTLHDRAEFQLVEPDGFSGNIFGGAQGRGKTQRGQEA